jgi:hypothetical protein
LSGKAADNDGGLWLEEAELENLILMPDGAADGVAPGIGLAQVMELAEGQGGVVGPVWFGFCRKVISVVLSVVTTGH